MRYSKESCSVTFRSRYLFIENFGKVINVAFNCLEMGNYIDK